MMPLPMRTSVVSLVLFGLVAGCADDEGSGGGGAYETLLSEDFSTSYPIGWYVSSPGAAMADVAFGFPAPSAGVRGRGFVSPPDAFTFNNQWLDTRVTTYLQNDQSYGEKYAVLRILPESLDEAGALATAAYRLINNTQTNIPINGFPAGNTAEIMCSFGLDTPVYVEVPYVDGQTTYDLFISIDAQGTRCGFGSTVVATASPTFATGTFRLGLGATVSTDAWFDNLVMRRSR